MPNVSTNPMIDLAAYVRSFKLQQSDFVVAKNSNLFIGGTTGRTGTSWLVRILRTLLKNQYIVIGEQGTFVLSQFRGAGYEYYQCAPGDKTNKEAYLNYFYKFVTDEAYSRRKIYGQGLRGLQHIVPRRAIRLAFDVLESELASAQSLQECNVCFGNFYSRLMNIHTLLVGGGRLNWTKQEEVVKNHSRSDNLQRQLTNTYSLFFKTGTLNWISKEPGYGRHVKELYDMIPDCRVVILARDGRDTALSMAKNGWCNGEVRQCIDRWRLFTQMTLDALELVPSENYLLINYEDLILDFNQKIRQILDFYGINLPQSVIDEESVKNPPIKDNFNKWKKAMGEAEIAYFEETCQAVMRQLGYETIEPLVQKQAL